LLLPALESRRTPGGIWCRAEPNPIAKSSIQAYFERKQRVGEEEDAFKPTRGFLADAEEAICIFTLRVLGAKLGNFQFGHTFTFIVHRNALVNIVEEFEREQEREAALVSQISEAPTIYLEQVGGTSNGVLGATEEDEGTLGYMDLGGDEWAFEHFDNDDLEEGSNTMSLGHDGSPIGLDFEAGVDGEEEQIGFAQTLLEAMMWKSGSTVLLVSLQCREGRQNFQTPWMKMSLLRPSTFPNVYGV